MRQAKKKHELRKRQWWTNYKTIGRAMRNSDLISHPMPYVKKTRSISRNVWLSDSTKSLIKGSNTRIEIWFCQSRQLHSWKSSLEKESEKRNEMKKKPPLQFFLVKTTIATKNHWNKSKTLQQSIERWWKIRELYRERNH